MCVCERETEAVRVREKREEAYMCVGREGERE